MRLTVSVDEVLGVTSTEGREEKREGREYLYL
jgi:hypothetical protein